MYQFDWKLDIGEMAVAITVGKVTRNLGREQYDIIVLGLIASICILIVRDKKLSLPSEYVNLDVIALHA